MNEQQMNEALGSFARKCVEKYGCGHLALYSNREDGSEHWCWEGSGGYEYEHLELGGRT